MQVYKVDGVEIPFNQEYKKVAVSLSGGADSALMTYLLCQLPSVEEIHCISHTRMWKTRPWQGWDSLNVFNWLTNRFPEKKFIRHTNFISPELEYGNIGPSLIDEYGKNVSGDNIEIRAFSEYTCHWNNISIYYNAVTRNPRNIDLGGMTERDIESNDDNQHLRIMKHMNGWAIHPFRFIEKDWILRQYYNHSIDDLLTITRSCEGEFDNIDYTNYEPGQYVPICGKCFWCKEREWAIESTKSAK